MNNIEFEKKLNYKNTTIPGLIIYDLPVHGDSRGWFKENWQREKMLAINLPDFNPIQNNISFNAKAGVTRGIHAEPWDKYVSITTGKIFGAWVDLREGDSFGKVFTAELDPSKAVFIPRGVGNAYQALEDNTTYNYLVNDHWSADLQSQYTFLNLADNTVNITWPISLDKAEISDKDKNHPCLDKVTAMKPKKILIIGSNGQLGRALQADFPTAECVDRETFDICNPSIVESRNWRQYDLILNAAAYTEVDLAETEEGRIKAWQINATAMANLAMISNNFGVKIVHISSDYVFNGQKTDHIETEPFSPLSVYGQSKAAGDIVISTAKKHYIIRTSWVIGDGKNFVKTMKELAKKEIKPSVVNDQIGRLTFTNELSRGIKHLIDSQSPYGTYNLTGDGQSASWAEIAKKVFELSGYNQDDITDITTSEYYANKTDIAPRPLQSSLSLEKIKSTGFKPKDWLDSLTEYLKNNKETS